MSHNVHTTHSMSEFDRIGSMCFDCKHLESIGSLRNALPSGRFIASCYDKDAPLCGLNFTLCEHSSPTCFAFRKKT